MPIDTEIIRIDPHIIELDLIERVKTVLRKDGVIVCPTETFYGLGANGFSQKAVKRVYRLKERSPSKPLSLIISDVSMLERVAGGVPSIYWPLLSEFWPGPLTVVLKAAPRLPKELQGATGSIGIRLTGHRWLRALVRDCGFPITATSANISGEKDISLPNEVIDAFAGKVELIVDAGETQGGMASTVVDLTGEKPRLIRPGTVPFSRIQKYLNV